MFIKRFIYLQCVFMTFTLIFIIYFLHKQSEEVVVLPPLETWPITRSRDIKDYINPNLEPILMPVKFCTHNLDLLIIVHSHPGSFAARFAIRSTWGNSSYIPQNSSIYFLLGETPIEQIQKEVVEESKEYDDIIQERFNDSYANLTLKSVFMLKLVMQCRNTKWLMKADTDLYVNVEKIINLSHMGESFVKNGILMGRLLREEMPVLDPKSKYYAPKYMFSGEFYPPFVAGTGYVMSIDVAERLYHAVQITPLFHLEDVYITGICAEAAGIHRSHVEWFTDSGIPSNLCMFTWYYVGHSYPPRVLRSLHNIRDDLDVICKFMNNGMYF